MATSLFFMPTDQNSVGNQSDILRNTHGSTEIQSEPQKSRGRKPGPKTTQQIPKKQKRGMGVAKLERLRIKSEEDEKTKLIGDTSAVVNPNNISRLPVPIVPDPVVVLQGFPSGCRSNRMYRGGVGSGQIMIHPVWNFVETSTTHDLSSISNPSNASYHRCDTCVKKKHLDGDQNVVRSNGGTMIPPMNGYDHPLQSDQRSQELFHDHRIARAASSFASNTTNPYFNEVIKTMGSLEEFGSYMEGNPRNNGSGGVKEYEFFPGKFGKRVSSSVLDDYTSSTIDLSLKL